MITLNRPFEKLTTGLKQISQKDLPMDRFTPLLWQHLEEFTVKDRKPLVIEGEIPKFLYYQISGTTHLKYHDKNGDMHVTRFYREGKIILSNSYLLQEPSPHSIVAYKGSLMFRLSFKNLKLILNELSGTLELLMRTVMDYDVNKERMREELLSKDGIDRVAHFYAMFPMLLPATSIRLDAEIAAYLSMSKVFLSQTRQKLGLK